MELSVGGKAVFAGTGGRGFDPALPCVVLLHGAGMDRTAWALQARSLAHHGRNVLALDLPGHGRSAGAALESIGALAEWVLAVLEARAIARFRIAGHSMGSLIALETAARAGEACDGLVLLGFAPEMRVHPDLLGAARAGGHAAIDFMVGWSFGAQAQLGGNPAPGLWRTGTAERVLEHTASASIAASLAACDAYRGAAEAAARLSCPVAFLLGGEDRMTPPSRAASFAERIAGARVTVLPGIGHSIMTEDPAGTLAALRTVL
jgi:pimeloyl-ACP methyl ester carboxylesterase